MEPTKALFLDVDGVLNNMKFAIRMKDEEGVMIFHEDILDPACIRNLKRIIDETGAVIVVSSSWRGIPNSMKNLAAQLNQSGMEIYSTTPSIYRKERGDEIAAWLKNNPSIKDFVILDDDSDMGELLPHLVNTDFQTGLLPIHISKAIEILNQGVDTNG